MKNPALVLNEAETVKLAGILAQRLSAPLVIYLHGDLGAGKTTFARAYIQALGYEGRVKSPTYGLLERYSTRRAELVHLDMYRISAPGELEFLGLGDLQTPDSIFLIEWPARGKGFLPLPDLEVYFSHLDTVRELEFVSKKPEISSLCKKLTENII